MRMLPLYYGNTTPFGFSCPVWSCAEPFGGICLKRSETSRKKLAFGEDFMKTWLHEVLISKDFWVSFSVAVIVLVAGNFRVGRVRRASHTNR
jgi:hypothetical protein